MSIIRRYKGNDYPMKSTISRNGDFTLSGTVRMYIKIGNLTLHTLTGVITDAVEGKVTFTPTPESVADVGEGKYEITVDDGSYEITYEVDDFEILKRVAS